MSCKRSLKIFYLKKYAEKEYQTILRRNYPSKDPKNKESKE